MMHRTIYIRGWRVDVFIDDGNEDVFVGEINICLDDMGAPDDIVERCNELIIEGKPNQAFTYSNGKRTCMYIGWTTSGDEFINSIVHELRHLVDHIADYHGLVDDEETAYMSGDAAFLLAKEICEIGCPRCRKEDKHGM